MESITTTVLAEGFIFLEGPRWHDGRLWMSDILAQTVYTLTLDGQAEEVFRLPSRPSGLGFLPDGTPLVVSMKERRLFRYAGGSLAVHAELGELVRADTNDMAVDSQGRAYIGNLGFDMMHRAPYEPGELVLVTPDGRARVVADDLGCPNGICLTPDERTLVVAETLGNCLTAFDVAPDGSLSARRRFADLGPAAPDGICMDQEGAVWVGALSRQAFLRVREGGQVTHRVECPGSLAIAPQLGGEDGCTFFGLTTIGGFVDEGEPLSESRVEIARVSVPGAGSP